MIIDRTQNLSRYDYIPGVKEVIEFLQKNKDFTAIENGKYDLGNGHIVKVSDYDTKEIPEEDIELEVHREFLDLQMVVSGEEFMFFQAIDLGEQVKEYNSVKDVEFYVAEFTNSVELNNGNFALIFPNDLHACCFNTNGVNHVKKLVFKLKLGE